MFDKHLTKKLSCAHVFWKYCNSCPISKRYIIVSFSPYRSLGVLIVSASRSPPRPFADRQLNKTIKPERLNKL